jgi:spermidine synthase
MSFIYSSVLAVSAFLVFWIQPLVARMVLPVLGGAPAVWNTCVLFFQAALLLGYLYSHLLAQLPFRVHSLLHVAVLALALVVAPNAPSVWIPPTDSSIPMWLLGNLVAYLGVPFVLLASTAPLLQHWFGISGSTRSKDPYFLYAASNFGSLLALVSFPLILERFLPLTEQFAFWNLAFYFAGAGVLSCLLLSWRGQPPAVSYGGIALELPGAGTLLRWLILAFVPSSLMLGVTTHVTTDIAAVSLLWILPLALYLVTFIAAFSRYGSFAARAVRKVLPLLLLGALLLVVSGNAQSLLQVPVLLLIFASISMTLHHRLYESRPGPSRLTVFYVAVAFGGLLGGVLNGLLAPMLFDDIVEVPLVMMLALVLVERPLLSKVWRVFRSARWAGFNKGGMTLSAVLAALVTAGALVASDLGTAALAGVLVFVSSLAGAYALGAMVGLRLIVFASFAISLMFTLLDDRGIHSGRTFFGSFTVRDSNEFEPPLRLFTHGTTVHGVQALEPALALSVRSYYSNVTGLLEAFIGPKEHVDIGITGLGAGTLACLGRHGDAVTFFEIDPSVEDVARSFFTYLDECPPATTVVLGDARLSLVAVEPKAYDLLILDAFSSDSVPIHLLTDEAAAVYQRVMREDGLMVFHISNRYLDLTPVLARLAAKRGWRAWKIAARDQSENPLMWSGTFVVMTLNEQTAKLVAGYAGALPLEDVPGFRLWTDDHSNLLDVLSWFPWAK